MFTSTSYLLLKIPLTNINQEFVKDKGYPYNL